MLYVHEKPPHALLAKEVVKHLSSHESCGLSSGESEKRLQKNGPNTLDTKKKITALDIYARQFKSAVIAILAFASVISYSIGEMIEAYAILGMIFVVTLIGFYQEYKAENILESIKNMVVTRVRVFRNGKIAEISSIGLVAGDMIFLEAGDKVPADARIVRSSELYVDESSMTGESNPVLKRDCVLSEDTPLADRKNMLFMGSYVSGGNASAIVTHTAERTEIGKIAKEVPQDEETPLEKSVSDFGKKLSAIVIVLGIFMIVFQVLKGAPIEDILIVSIAVAVSGIPEGLPIIMTIGLSHGVHAMAKKNALIRKMGAVETLGCVSVICTDKTGTLTKNEMTVAKLYSNDSIIGVQGTGYSPEGALILNGKKITAKNNETLNRFITAGVLCNNARLKKEDNGWFVMGDSTEGSLIVLGKKAGLSEDQLSIEYERAGELTFTSERKCMSTIHIKGGDRYMFSKGAPGYLLENCAHIEKDGKITLLSKKEKEKIIETYESFSSEALRVIAIAYKTLPSGKMPRVKDEIADEKDLIFLGLAGIQDPIRDGVKESIEACRKAGIKTVMITGDHITTATSIAREIGLIKSNELVMEGSELDKLSEEEFSSIVERISVYARVTAEHKLRIIAAFEKKGHVVAMTGDGVNDIIALKKAHVSISMGLKGTDIAKEASDIILLDDNFNTIVSAIKEGRSTYNNLKNAMRFMLSISYAEMCVVVTAILIGIPLPITALMVLFINLVTDDLPGMGMSMDSAKHEVINRNPRKKDEPLIDRSTLESIIYNGTIFTIAVLGFFSINYFYFGEDLLKSQTVAFASLMAMEIIFAYGIKIDGVQSIKHAFSNKSLNFMVVLATIAAILAIEHPLLQSIFETTGLTLLEWISVILASTIV
ncbi:MAG: cation-transporting P-type ATPase, partial [Nanoarchaeota archaeon]|nr:cation-transporting P-type ATPase [Nanoarchaeota archaeon]